MKPKIAVYTICCDEAKNALTWYASAREADLVIAADTGSTDDTVAILQALGAQVYPMTISPWRFDVARNMALQYVPEDVDICISLDLDETLSPGWRECIERVWTPEVTRFTHAVMHPVDPGQQQRERVVACKIHARQGYRWVYPVHEALQYGGGGTEQAVFLPCLEIMHNMDFTKDRQSYLSLMETAVAEDPENARHLHHLGRTYMAQGDAEQCIHTMLQHLSLPSVTSSGERSASMRFIARAYGTLGDYNNAKNWVLAAIAAAPETLDCYMEHVLLAYRFEQWKDLLASGERALQVQPKAPSSFYELQGLQNTLFDLLALAAYHLKAYHKACDYIEKALERDKDNPRLRENQRLYQDSLRSAEGMRRS